MDSVRTVNPEPNKMNAGSMFLGNDHLREMVQEFTNNQQKDTKSQFERYRKPYYILKHEAIWGIKPILNLKPQIDEQYEKEQKAIKDGSSRVVARNKKEIEHALINRTDTYLKIDVERATQNQLEKIRLSMNYQDTGENT